MKFRFTAEHFVRKVLEGVLIGADEAHGIAEMANAALEAEEAKCERVYEYVYLKGKRNRWFCPGPNEKMGQYNPGQASALLWNVEKIGEGEK